MVADPEFSVPARASEGSPVELRRMPYDVRQIVSWVAHLLDNSIPLRSEEDGDEFAQRHLGVDAAQMISVSEWLGPLSTQLVANALATDLVAHPPVAVMGSSSDDSPKWRRITLDGETRSVPSVLNAAFSAGTLLDVGCVLGIDTHYEPYDICVRVRSEDAHVAEAYLGDLLDRARGVDNFLRGRLLRAHGGRVLRVEQMPTPKASRDQVVVPPRVWAELDTNVAALFNRRGLLEAMDLGTNRGVLLVGPPGTGKSALCRALAVELLGDVTVMMCDAAAIAGQLRGVYAELAHCGPSLVVLEDLDLVVADRARGGGRELHEFLNTLDGAMSAHDGIVTVATTNNVGALDVAAVRSARFDCVIDVPLPDAPARSAILARYLGEHAGAVDLAAVAGATAGASGADLRELVRRTVLDRGADVTTSALQAAARDSRFTRSASGFGLSL